MSSPETLSQDEIDNLLNTLGSAQASKSGGNPGGGNAGASLAAQADEMGSVGSEKRNYKVYNFRRPDKFSKDQLRALQTIHDSFARQLGMMLSAYLRMSIEIDVVSVDQLTYEEFVRSMPSPITVTIIEMAPLEGQSLLGISHEITSSMIDRMLGGPGQSEPKPRELTDIEQSLIKRVIDRTLEALEEAWHSFVSVNINIIGIEDSYSLIQVASPGEIVALITFEINLANRDSGLMSLCIPYPVLEMVLSQLSAQHIFHRQNESLSPDAQDKILDRIYFAKTGVQSYLGGTRIMVKEMLELSVGDVIRLDRFANEEVLLNVNGRPKFYGRPGKVKNKMAVYITDEVYNEEILEGFGLYERTNSKP